METRWLNSERSLSGDVMVRRQVYRAQSEGKDRSVPVYTKSMRRSVEDKPIPIWSFKKILDDQSESSKRRADGLRYG